jgi:hypothetical protein
MQLAKSLELGFDLLDHVMGPRPFNRKNLCQVSDEVPHIAGIALGQLLTSSPNCLDQNLLRYRHAASSLSLFSVVRILDHS